MPDVDDTIPSPAPSAASRAEFVASLYDLHQRELFTFALRARRDHRAAEDLVHEAFVQLIAEVDAGRLPRNVRAWLHRAVASAVASAGGQEAPPEPSPGDQASGDEPVESGPAGVVDRPDPIDIALGELEGDGRTALLLAANGFNGLEVAEAIGRSATATRSLMTRARLQLHDQLLPSPDGSA
jgi:DNA-directed RNA polymerase specialized sigma24 family protein